MLRPGPKLGPDLEPRAQARFSFVAMISAALWRLSG